MRLLGWILLAQLALSTAGLAQQGTMPPLPPISAPPTGEHLPGKFVWADLFSSDVEKSRRFYEQVFGWEWQEIKPPPQPYGIFYLDGLPVAGLAHREAPDGGSIYGRWVHYISVANVGATEIAVEQRGGSSLLKHRSFEERGDFAILSDLESAPFGVMRSSSGDPGDYRAEPGEWIWHELFTHDLRKAIGFYTGLFGYESEKDEALSEILDYLLTSQGYLRAGIGSLPPDSDTAPTWLGYVRVKDIDVALKRVSAQGGKIVLEPRADIADGSLAIITDPTGASIGLLQWEYGEESRVERKP
jgi:predicted enzyme related to lactoylglutathione lyase